MLAISEYLCRASRVLCNLYQDLGILWQYDWPELQGQGANWNYLYALYLLVKDWPIL